MEGCHILVCTVGRLKDFLDKGNVSFANVRYFVLDEADRMLDQGFMPEVRGFLTHSTMPKVGVDGCLLGGQRFDAIIFLDRTLAR